MLGDELPEDLTTWLNQLASGEREVAERVLTVLWQELRSVAARALAGENRNHSLQPTLLVDDALMRLLKAHTIEWNDRKHFFNAAAKIIRQIIIDYFRGRGAHKRVPRELQIPLDEVMVFNDDRRDEALMVDEALERFSKVSSRAAKVVELRYFGGLTIDQTAEALGISDKTVKRDWGMAQWWLRRHFGRSGDGAATAVVPDVSRAS